MSTIELKGLSQPIAVEDILYFSSDGPYAYLHTLSGDTISIWLCLEYIHRKLPDLIRVHRGYLVNAQYILAVRPGQVELARASVVPIARRRRQQFATVLSRQSNFSR